MPMKTTPVPYPSTSSRLRCKRPVTGQVSGDPIQSISQGSLNGRTVYDINYNRGGQYVTMRVADDGSVLGSWTTP